MNNEVAVYEESVPAIADDSLLAMAKQAEARIDAVIKIKQLALKVTNGGDWTDQGGKPYLQASGAEKIANLFNISWGFLTPEPLYEEDADGHFTYTFRGRFSMGGRTIEVEGSRSSRDPFFKQFVYEGEGQNKTKREKDVHERDNKRDVKMAALTNLLGNGITRLLGIRNLSYADLEKFADLKREDMGKVEYKTKGEPKEPIKEPQKKAAPTEDTHTAQITVKDVTSKSDEKNGKAYTIFTIFDEAGTKYGTFSDTFADLASSAKESELPVSVTYTTGKFGNKIVNLEVVVKD